MTWTWTAGPRWSPTTCSGSASATSSRSSGPDHRARPTRRRCPLSCLRTDTGGTRQGRPGGERDRGRARAREERVRAAHADPAPPAAGARGDHDLPHGVRAQQQPDPDGPAARAGRGAPGPDAAGGGAGRPHRHGPGGLPALDARPVAGAVARRGGPRGLRADLARAAGAGAGEEPRPRPGHAQRAPGRHHPRHRPPLQLRGQPRPDGPRDDPQRGDRPAAGRARPPRRRRGAGGRDRGLHARGVHRAAVADLRAAERLRPGRGALRDHPDRDPRRLPGGGPSGR